MVWSAEIILCFVTIWKYNIKEHLLDHHHEQCEKYANEFCLSNKEWEMVLKFKLVLKCICSEYSFVFTQFSSIFFYISVPNCRGGIASHDLISNFPPFSTFLSPLLKEHLGNIKLCYHVSSHHFKQLYFQESMFTCITQYQNCLY